MPIGLIAVAVFHTGLKVAKVEEEALEVGCKDSYIYWVCLTMPIVLIAVAVFHTGLKVAKAEEEAKEAMKKDSYIYWVAKVEEEALEVGCKDSYIYWVCLTIPIVYAAIAEFHECLKDVKRTEADERKTKISWIFTSYCVDPQPAITRIPLFPDIEVRKVSSSHACATVVLDAVHVHGQVLEIDEHLSDRSELSPLNTEHIPLI
eukprot:gene27648-7287_t